MLPNGQRFGQGIGQGRSSCCCHGNQRAPQRRRAARAKDRDVSVRWLTVEEHAAKRHTTPGAILTERWRGGGPPAVRAGRRLLWDEAAVDKWLQAQARSPS